MEEDQVNFETLDSGTRAEYDSGMVRDTEEGKERFDLLLPLDTPYEAQLVVRAKDIALAEIEPIDAKSDLNAVLGDLSAKVDEHMTRWLLEDHSKDYAALAFAEITWIVDVIWSAQNGSLDQAPYEDLPMTRLAALMARGAVKYDARNWEKGNGLAELLRAYSSGLRHWRKFVSQQGDEDHMAGALFNLLSGDYYQRKLKRGWWNEEERYPWLSFVPDLVDTLKPEYITINTLIDAYPAGEEGVGQIEQGRVVGFNQGRGRDQDADTVSFMTGDAKIRWAYRRNVKRHAGPTLCDND
jgi:hypothetical protein